MPPDSAVAASTRSDPLYSALEERVMARDQKGASEVYYSLVREGRPLPEMLREADRKSTRLNSSHRSLSRMPSSA